MKLSRLKASAPLAGPPAAGDKYTTHTALGLRGKKYFEIIPRD